MKKHSPIWNELMEISPAVANLDSRLPFTVPYGYFEGLPDQIILRIRSLGTQDPVQELENIAPALVQIPRSVPYSHHPQGYFENLSGEIISRLRKDGSSLTAGEEMSSLSPLLESLRHKQVFQVPENYFDQLAQEIQVLAQASSSTPIVPLSAWKKGFRMAAAALIIGIIGIGAWIFLQPKSVDQPSSQAAQLHKLPMRSDTVLSTYLPELSDDALANYLDNEGISMGTSLDTSAEEINSLAMVDFNESDLSSLIQDITDDEIQQYLKDFPGSKDASSSN